MNYKIKKETSQRKSIGPQFKSPTYKQEQEKLSSLSPKIADSS